MQTEQIMEASETLLEVAKNLSNMPTERQKALAKSAACTIASLVLTELAKHLVDGLEPYDAYEATARDELDIPAEKLTLIRLFAANPKK